MAIALRPARAADYAFCARLYGEDLGLYIPDPAARAAKLASLAPRWKIEQVRIVQRDGTDVGWLQGAATGRDFFIIQFFIESALRGQGIGAAVLALVIDEATAADRDVTLEVMKENRALGLYRRLGFQITGESGPKFQMRRPASS